MAKRNAILMNQINQKYDGFVITRLEDSNTDIIGHTIKQFDEISYTPGETGFIIGLGNKNKAEVLRTTLIGVSSSDIFDENIDYLIY